MMGGVPAIREGWCPECENFRHSALIGGPCYCEGGEVQEVEMVPVNRFRELVAEWRRQSETVNHSGADDAEEASFQVLNGCADELEALLDDE